LTEEEIREACVLLERLPVAAFALVLVDENMSFASVVNMGSEASNAMHGVMALGLEQASRQRELRWAKDRAEAEAEANLLAAVEETSEN